MGREDSTREEAELLECDVAPLVWRISAGTRRERPARGESEIVEQDELWLSLPDAPVVSCSYLTAANTVERSELHAGFEPRLISDDVLKWIDLDLDVVLDHDTVKVLDEEKFMENARSMSDPDHVVRAVWAGIATVTPRFVNHEWPFDGFLEALALGKV